ncbi:RagB/SusD family nutrient uptake outer membrane protein [Dyadobacter sp. NIV53]|uniref:RagB/SusD family nutrient uptake outer membrane protein n=1 Tax=Dyadobacter sp. NIV53 TaxID=2861765 RepID=UPI001C8816E0|nr:RagB/SusD family nutrient uptake outer membrane protein [Dyadobacter sp. NIV53]
MKRYNSLILASVLLISSCSSKLDLVPQQEIEGEIALSSDTNIKRVLGGAYDAISSSYVLGGDIALFSELLASNDEIAWEGTYNQPREIYTKKILVTNSYVRDMWLDSYKTINISNNILGAIDKVNEDDQDRVKGEALMLRAITYFELAQLFCLPYSDGAAATNPGLPIVLTPTTVIEAGTKVTRSTLEATYAQILADATEAEGLLPETNGIFLSQIAANAYLSRIYLQMTNYSKALEASNKAIGLAATNGITLTSTYAAAFNNATNSSEDIFDIQVSDQDGDNDMQLFWSIPAYGGRDGDVSIQDKHLALYEANDARLKLFYEGAGSIRSGKWMLQYRNIPVIRLAELYLTRAECNLRLSSQTGATPAADLNLIRRRAGLAAITTPTLPIILKERKLELAHEGQAIQDLKRLKGTTDGLEYNSTKLVLPIPQREVDASGIAQNSGY